MLAVRVLQAQNIDVVALNFQTMFTAGGDQAKRAAQQLGVSLTKLVAGDEYLDVVRAPRFGYGQGANPCLDCRIYLWQRARQMLIELNADFLATGDVVGQRLMGQKRRDFDVIDFHGGCDDLVLRPLSAKRFPPTLPEREGWIDRERLFDFSGTGRRKQIALARRLGIREIPPQTTGCVLVDKHFGAKVHELVQLSSTATGWEFELLKIGRHFRIGQRTKAIVGRNAAENDELAQCFLRRRDAQAALITPIGFNGPTVLVTGATSDAQLQTACDFITRYSHDPRAKTGQIRVQEAQGPAERMSILPCPASGGCYNTEIP